MRVLVVSNQWPRPSDPGCGIIVVRQVDSLAAEGVDATVLAIDGRFRSYLRAAGSILALNVRRKGVDLVHAHTGHSGILACLQLRAPVVCSFVGYDLDVTGESEALRRKVERAFFRALAAFMAVPVVKSKRAVGRLPRGARQRAAVVPNGVDRQLFRPMPRASARERLGWDDRPVVLFAADPGREVKRFGLAQAAVEEARRLDPSLRLEVCARFPREEMPVRMNAADVLLLTSLSEGSPNVVKEAMACNLPVVSVDVGDVPDVIGGARHCYICPAEPSQLADAILRVVAVLPERSDGRQRTRHLDEAEIAKIVRSVYERAVGRGPGVLGGIGRTS